MALETLTDDPQEYYMRKSMKLLDKKLYRLSDELLYYVIKRAESILNTRAERLKHE